MPMPAGSPRAITNRWVASSEEDMAVLRLFLLGLLLVGLATGLRYEWLQVNWNRFLEDVGLNSRKLMLQENDARPRAAS